MTKDESQSDASDVEKQTNSTKRKADLEEIEVDVTAPEPPSKRAKRALKKGRSTTSRAPIDDDKDDDEEANGKAAKVRSEHSIWVGNLPFTLNGRELREWLVNNSGGVITTESITRIKLPTVKNAARPKDEKPANKGFAYVDFTDIGGKVAAIALSETELNGRRLLIKDAKSFEGRPKKEKEEDEGAEKGAEGGRPAAKGEPAVDPNASRKVFVGNLSFKVTEEDVWHNFEKCGEIASVKLATFEDTGKCKGYGWVTFKDPVGASWAVKGFVKIKEAIETEADFQEGEEGAKKDQQKQFNTRKWWVNRMLGRELKLELAEDDQTRYKKRFGKDRPKNGAPREKGNFGRRQDRNGDEPITEVKPAKETDINVARLTGKVVEHTGTKMSFD